MIKVTEEGLKIYEPKKRMTMMDQENQLFFYIVGRRTLPIPSYGKVILLAGATGAGKINVLPSPLGKKDPLEKMMKDSLQSRIWVNYASYIPKYCNRLNSFFVQELKLFTVSLISVYLSCFLCTVCVLECVSGCSDWTYDGSNWMCLIANHSILVLT